jgi:long-chain acyl-CoA synthetase
MARSSVRTLARLTRLLERGAGDLTLAQFRVLALVDEGGERASQLADRLAVGKPTVTAVVDGLVERGYLRRTADEHDKRATRITLTADGWEALDAAEAAMTERLDTVLGHAAGRRAILDALADLDHAIDVTRQERLARR